MAVTMANEINWKEKFHALTENIDRVEGRMTHIVNELMRERDAWKQKYFQLERSDRSTSFIHPRYRNSLSEMSIMGSETKQFNKLAQTTKIHEHLVGGYWEPKDLASLGSVDDIIKEVKADSNIMNQPINDIFKSMLDGRIFNVYTPEGNAICLVQCYCPDMNLKRMQLRWSPAAEVSLPNTASHSSGTIPFSEISAVYIGKQTSTFQMSNFVLIDVERCASVISSNSNELNIEAISENQLKVWLVGLHCILGAYDKMMNTNQNKIKSEYIAHSNTHNGFNEDLEGLPRTTNELITFLQKRRDTVLSIPRENNIEMLKKGNEFIRHLPKHREKINLCYNSESLVWFPTTSHFKQQDNSFPLHSISNIIVGASDGFDSALIDGRPTDIFISLISPTQQLFLEACSPQQVFAWMLGINDILEDQCKTIKYDEQLYIQRKKKQRFSAFLGLTDEQRQKTKNQIIEDMRTGFNVTNFGILEEPLKEKNILYFNGKKSSETAALSWYKPCNRYRRINEKFLLIKEITDIYMLKDHDFFKKQRAIAADFQADQCISIITNTKQLHIAFESAILLKEWLSGLRYLFSKPDQKTLIAIDSVNIVKNFVVVPKLKETLTPDENVRYCTQMEEGEVFYMYINKGQGVERKRMFLTCSKSNGILYGYEINTLSLSNPDRKKKSGDIFRSSCYN